MENVGFLNTHKKISNYSLDLELHCVRIGVSHNEANNDVEIFHIRYKITKKAKARKLKEELMGKIKALCTEARIHIITCAVKNEKILPSKYGARLITGRGVRSNELFREMK
jgi:hypothetical protein